MFYLDGDSLSWCFPSTRHKLQRHQQAACFGYINSNHRAVQEKTKSLGVQVKNVVRDLKKKSKKKNSTKYTV